MIIRADRFLCPVWVTSDKAHIEHNESALALIAGVPSDMDFRRNGPIADSCGGLVAVARADILDEELRHLGRVHKIRNQICPATDVHVSAASWIEAALATGPGPE
jgi:hypothetical protein